MARDNTRGQARSTTIPYEALAERYDQFFRWQRGVWRRARRELLKGLPGRVSSHCDLGCGTGNTALESAGRGVRVFAVDRSPAMCRLVRRRARARHLPIRVFEADIRSFRLPETVDLVTCEFHALNHLLREQDFRRTLRRVRAALRPGGFFYFDCAHPAMYESASAENRCYDEGGLFLLRGYHYNPARHQAHFEATWFIRRGARWQRFDERIPQVPWPDRKVREMLRREGFEIQAIRDGARFLPAQEGPRARGFVSFYLARRG